MDIIEGGNEFGFQPQFGRLDANFGTVLINDKKGGFSVVPQSVTGLNMKGQVRDIAKLAVNGKEYFLFLQNNEMPQLFKLSKSGDYKTGK